MVYDTTLTFRISKMVWREVLTVTLSGIIYAPSVFFLSSVIFLAAVGKSFGIRKLYVKFLLAVFEVCQ